MTHDVRALGPDELRASRDLFGATIHRGPASDATWERAAPHLAEGRTLGVDLDGVLAGTADSVATRTAVPGGAVLPTSAVTRIGVRPDRTRRGVLTALVRAQLRAAAEAGEPLASLRASEAVIYGRFGYGVATRGRDLRVDARSGAWRPGAPAAGDVRLVDRADAVAVLSRVHDAIATARTGGIARWPGWWSAVLARRLDEREHLLVAVHRGADGDDGFAVAAVAPGNGFRRTLEVVDLHARDVPAAAALWRFLLDIDLVDAVEAPLRPLDEPLELLLADPRAVRTTGQHDETWLRLVDVPAALAARSFAPAEPLHLAVHDPLLERNSGVHRIADGTAERVGPLDGPVAAHLRCDVAALAMAYLGDRRPSELVHAGRWEALDPAAVARADAAFATAGPAPWCGTYF